MSALFLHLELERPTSKPRSFEKRGTQLAEQAGYTVVGVASARHEDLTKSFGVSHFVDRASSTVVQDLVAHGPFKAVLAAADSAEDQVKIGEVLAEHGGGRFLSTMGVRPGVQLPDGVTGVFRQFLDDFINPKNKEFTQWVWWDYLEAAFADSRLKTVPLEVKGGLSQVSEAWGLLRQGNVSGTRLIIQP
jgi:D-arabinose 1-dehydrogenase-like Zn-dependent alcohol dehydrogenase